MGSKQSAKANSDARLGGGRASAAAASLVRREKATAAHTVKQEGILGCAALSFNLRESAPSEPGAERGQAQLQLDRATRRVLKANGRRGAKATVALGGKYLRGIKNRTEHFELICQVGQMLRDGKITTYDLTRKDEDGNLLHKVSRSTMGRSPSSTRPPSCCRRADSGR